MKKQLLFLLLCASISFSGWAQSVSFTSVPTSTSVGTNITVDYKYTATTLGKVTLFISKNGGANAWDYISAVAYSETPAVVGTNVTGSFTVLIPNATTPTASLTGNQNYRFTLELKDASNNWLTGDYSVINYNFTATAAVVPSVNVTSIPTSTQVGTNLNVNYKYTAASTGKVSVAVTKNGGVNAWDYISTVGYMELDPAAAGTDVTGTFTVAIPGETIPTSSLTGNENYRVTLELKDGSGNWLAGDYNNINYSFTAAPLGIDKKNLVNRLSVYPNPVSDILKIANSDNLTNASFSIVDILGKTVVQSKALNNDAIDVSNLSSGVYILSVSSEDGAKQLKFQKK